MYEEKEIWKDIPHYEGRYLISNYGRVFSLLTNKILAMRQNDDGYMAISLNTDKQKRKTERIHRLVALAFIDNPEGKTEVNHINCIRNDNRVENLEWATREENNAYASQQGNKGWHKVLCIETGEVFNTCTEAATKNGGDKANIRKSARSNGKNSVYGFRYKYI